MNLRTSCTILIFSFHLNILIKNLIGEWTPGEESEIQGPTKDNAVLGHIIHRLFKIVAPPEVSCNGSEMNENECKGGRMALILSLRVGGGGWSETSTETPATENDHSEFL